MLALLVQSRVIRLLFSVIQARRFTSINADDAPMSFGLTWRFTRNQIEQFRDWLEADNFAVLNGEQFDINLPTDTGIILQSVSFSP